MSLILEALRKSEAERRRGQTPDLLSDTEPAARAARVAASRTLRGPWTLGIGAGTAVALALLFWWANRTSTPPADESGVATASASTTRVPDSGMPYPRAAVADREPRSVASTMQASEATPPAPAHATTVTPATQETNVPPASTASASSTEPAGTAPVDEPQSAAPDMTTAPQGTAVAATEPAPAASVQPEPTPVFTSPDVPVRLSELSSQDRQQLPPLKLSMHMWAPDAANRFAIVDGNRVSEGDRIGEAVVEAIARDGVVLSWRGRRIRLSIR
ncbi:general secretion pathway protein GspB [Lysobacter fragariae]